ncbi:chromosome-anchoring protein RacA [bacterium LRH843]|nr:chromosome-anchoring protein RacA [bacterium LRH843]
MEMTLKTKDVSEQLGVNPTTVQRWAKCFGLNCETNEHGHYLFSMKHVEVMQEVQQQLQEGKRMKEIDVSSFAEVVSTTKNNVRTKVVETVKYEAKLEEVITRVQELEDRISQKADEVVSYQLLKHRSELEDMMKLIIGLEERLSKMEERINEQSTTDENQLPLDGVKAPKKWRTLMQLFSF